MDLLGRRLTDFFVSTALEFLHTAAATLQTADPRLVPLIAPERGVSGALMSAATAITLLSAWDWRRGESWLRWTLAATAVTGFAPPTSSTA